MRVVWCGKLVLDSIFLQETFKNLVDEMSFPSLITTLRTPKRGKMMLLNIFKTTLASFVGLVIASTHFDT